MAKKKLSGLSLILKKMAIVSVAKFATKSELSQNEADHLHPVDINSLTPSSTFTKNAIIGINGVLYRATQATNNLPITLVEENGAFVTHTVNGKIAYVIDDTTINQGWEIFMDASIEYSIAALSAALASKQNTISDIDTIRQKSNSALQPTDVYTYKGANYTVDAMLKEVVKLMSKTVVTQD